jgi:hypothetical protein
MHIGHKLVHRQVEERLSVRRRHNRGPDGLADVESFPVFMDGQQILP